MLRLQARVDKLERVLVPAKGPRDRVRVLICGMTKPADLATSTCTRRLSNGVLTEVVQLDGDRDDLNDEQLESFIESFPIQTEAAAC
jgi:hypothetical protein